MTKATYIGPDPALQGKLAEVRRRGAVLQAKFEDPATGLSAEWRDFTPSEFHTEAVLTEISQASDRELNGG